MDSAFTGLWRLNVPLALAANHRGLQRRSSHVYGGHPSSRLVVCILCAWQEVVAFIVMSLLLPILRCSWISIELLTLPAPLLALAFLLYLYPPGGLRCLLPLAHIQSFSVFLHAKRVLLGKGLSGSACQDACCAAGG